jgi:hypothetical protein
MNGETEFRKLNIPLKDVRSCVTEGGSSGAVILTGGVAVIVEHSAERAAAVARLQIGRVDHDRLAPRGLRRRQTFHHPKENTLVAPPLPAVVQRLVRPIVLRRAPPAQPVAIDEIIPLNTRRSSTRGLPWLFGKYGSSRAICSSVSQ